MKRLLALAVTTGACLILPTAASAADANGCDEYASTAPGSTITTPQQLVDALASGEVGCFRAGTYTAPATANEGTNKTVSVDVPNITLKSVPGQQAVVRGRIVITGSGVTIRGLRLDGSFGPACAEQTACRTRPVPQNPLDDCIDRAKCTFPSPTIEATGVQLLDNDISNRDPADTAHAGICVNQAKGFSDISGYVIDRNRIHDCGQLPARNHDHGIYLADGPAGSAGGWIRENVIFDNADRGIQLAPNPYGAKMDNNTLDGNGQGLHYGGNTAPNPDWVPKQGVARNNIITNSIGRWNLETFDYANDPTFANGNRVLGVCLLAANPNSYYNYDNGIQGDPGPPAADEPNFRNRVEVSGDVPAPSNVYANRANKNFTRVNGCTGMGAPATVAEPPAFAPSEETYVIDSCGAVRVRPANGNANTPWSDASGQGCAVAAKQVVNRGGRVAYIDGSNQLWAKDPGGSFQNIRSNVKEVDINATAMLVLDTDTKVFGKSGAVTNAWTSQLSHGAKTIELAPTGDSLFMVVLTDGLLYAKGNGWYSAWSLISDTTVDVELSSDRLAVLKTCPTAGEFYVGGKLGHPWSAWMTVSGCGSSKAIAMGSGRTLANVAPDGSVSLRSDLNASATQVLDAGQAATPGPRMIAVGPGRFGVVDNCGGLLTKDLNSAARGLSEPLRRVRDCGTTQQVSTAASP